MVKLFRLFLAEFLETRIVPAVFNVINSYDSGLGSFRQAVLDSNANPSTINEIDFSVPTVTETSSPPVCIAPASLGPKRGNWYFEIAGGRCSSGMVESLHKKLSDRRSSRSEMVVIENDVIVHPTIDGSFV